MKPHETLTAISGGKLTALQFVAVVIRKASKAAENAALCKGHTIAFGLAFLLHHWEFTLAEAVDHLHDQAGKNKGKKENFKSFNHLLPRAMEMVQELTEAECIRYGKNGDSIGLAIPKRGEWPVNKVARDVLAIAGLSPMEAIGEGTTFSMLLEQAEEKAMTSLEEQARKDDKLESFDPSEKGIGNRIGKLATTAKADKKEANVITAEKQASDEHVVQLIRAKIGKWTQAQIANMAAALEEAQASLNGVK